MVRSKCLRLRFLLSSNRAERSVSDTRSKANGRHFVPARGGLGSHIMRVDLQQNRLAFEGARSNTAASRFACGEYYALRSDCIECIPDD